MKAERDSTLSPRIPLPDPRNTICPMIIRAYKDCITKRPEGGLCRLTKETYHKICPDPSKIDNTDYIEPVSK